MDPSTRDWVAGYVRSWLKRHATIDPIEDLEALAEELIEELFVHEVSTVQPPDHGHTVEQLRQASATYPADLKLQSASAAAAQLITSLSARLHRTEQACSRMQEELIMISERMRQLSERRRSSHSHIG